MRLTETSNRALLYDLYPYVWDVKEVLQLLDTFVNWLSTKNKRKKQKGQSFYPEDPEPWVFRGGLCGELQVWMTPLIMLLSTRVIPFCKDVANEERTQAQSYKMKFCCILLPY